MRVSESRMKLASIMPSVSIFAVEPFRLQSYDDFSILWFHKKRHNFHFLQKSFIYI